MSLTVGVDASVVASSSGGTRVYALQLLTHLLEVRPDWRFVLYLRKLAETEALGSLASSPNVRATVIPGRPNALRIQVKLVPQLRRDGVDLFHSMGFFLPLRWRGPKVVTIHDMNVYTHAREWLRGRTVLRWIDLALQTPLSVRAADRVITDSEFSRAEIERHLRSAKGKVSVIPLAADPYFREEPSPADREAATAIAHGKPYVLSVGILSPMKNLGTLLHAFATSALPKGGVRLVLAGSDREGYGANLREQARALGVGDSVDFTGFVPDSTLRALYWSALCLVLPSHGEGFGLPLVEGMAAGAPILAADRQSIPEVLGAAGRLFDPADVAGLAGLLDRIASEPGFRKEMAAAAAESRDRYSWVRTAEQTAVVYEEVLAARRR